MTQKMSPDELGQQLKQMYDRAPYGNKTEMIHLFGVLYAKEISHQTVAVVAAAGIPPSYVTEVHKGIRLSKYVTVKPSVRRGFTGG